MTTRRQQRNNKILVLLATWFQLSQTVSALRILLTNNNGIEDPGIQLLKDSLLESGHDVYVYAPTPEQGLAQNNGAGMALTLPFVNVTQVDDAGKEFSVGGYTSTCVLIGLSAIQAEWFPELTVDNESEETFPPRIDLGKQGLPSATPQIVDLILSGINDGFTSGNQDFHSGTLGGAMTGLSKGIPSLAIMSDAPDKTDNTEYFTNVARFVTNLVDTFDDLNFLGTIDPAAAEDGNPTGVWPIGVGLKIIYPNVRSTEDILGVVLAENNNDFSVTFDYVLSDTMDNMLEVNVFDVEPENGNTNSTSEAGLVAQGFITALPIKSNIAIPATQYNANFLAALRDLSDSGNRLL